MPNVSPESDALQITCAEWGVPGEFPNGMQFPNAVLLLAVHFPLFKSIRC